MMNTRKLPIRQSATEMPQSVQKETEFDRQSSKVLANVLESLAPLDTQEGTNHRVKVLADLERMVREFVTKTCISKGIDSHAAKQAGGKICVSGSYRLGINEPDADIDAVCFVPRHVSREDFFTTLYKMLDECDDVTDLKPPIRDARVPLMNLVFRDIEIDLIMARLPVERVDKDMDIRFDEILKGVEVTEIRSINGPRDNEVLSDLVHNFENFKIVLRAVRLWAKRRGIFKNKFGYLGGINCVILTAFVCQSMPKALPSKLLYVLFQMFSKWEWPKPVRVALSTESARTLYDRYGGGAERAFHPWDAQYAMGGQCSCGCGYRPNRYEAERNMMPMITPCFPNINSMKATWATLEAITEELDRARDIVDEIKIIKKGFKKKQKKKKKKMDKDLEIQMEKAWTRIFDPYCFPAEFDLFISVGCEGADQESFESFQGYLGSCLLAFAKSTDQMQYLTQLRLHIKEFEGAWWPRSRGKCECHCCHRFQDNGDEASEFITSEDGRFCKNYPEKTKRYVCFWLLGVRVNREILGERNVDLRRAFNRFWFSEKYGSGAIMKKGPFSQIPERKAAAEGKPQEEVDRLRQAREHAENSMFLHLKTLTWSDLKAKFSNDLILDKFGGEEEVNRVRDARVQAEEKKRKEMEEEKKKREEEEELKRLEENKDEEGDVEMNISGEEDGDTDTKQKLDSDQHDVDKTERAMRERDAKIITDAKRWRAAEDGTFAYDDEIPSLYCSGCGDLFVQKRKRLKLMLDIQ